MPNLDSVLTTLNTNTETTTAIHSAHNLTVCAVMGIYWRHYHVKNKKYGNFVSISSLTGKCTAQKFKKNLQFYSLDMFTLYGHINRLISQNRITDFFMISAWASPFNSAGRALSSKILWPTKINLLRQKRRYCSKCGAAIEWCWASFIFRGNPTIRPTFYKSGTGYSLHQASPDNTIHWPNADVMLGHCLRPLANIIPIKTLYGLITIFNHEHILYLNTS